MLSTTDHSRDSAGLTYVYPVISRRSGGLSIGINLNTNNACNWRCIYCQVPDLVRGSAPAIDLALLEQELDGFLDQVIQGDFFARQGIAAELQNICDIALSGNGESTSAAEFEQVIEIVAQLMTKYRLLPATKLVLISNGSLAHQAHVQRGVARMAKFNGEIWFKIDTATNEGLKRINNAALSVDRMRDNLRSIAPLCPTWLQTCFFKLDGEPPADTEIQAYMDFVAQVLDEHIPLKGILLYGLARPSMQEEAPRLSALESEQMQAHAERLRSLGVEVRLSI